MKNTKIFTIMVFALIVSALCVVAANDVYVDTNHHENDIVNVTVLNATTLVGDGSLITGIAGSTYDDTWINTTTNTSIDEKIALNNASVISYVDASDDSDNLTESDIMAFGFTQYTNFSTEDSNLTFSNGIFGIGNGLVSWLDSVLGFTTESNVAGKFVNRTDWTSIDDYPTGCGDGMVVKAVGDVLTCVSDESDNLTSNDIESFGYTKYSNFSSEDTNLTFSDGVVGVGAGLTGWLESVLGFVTPAEMATNNDSVISYVGAQDVVFNDSMKTYVDANDDDTQNSEATTESYIFDNDNTDTIGTTGNYTIIDGSNTFMAGSFNGSHMIMGNSTNFIAVRVK